MKISRSVLAGAALLLGVLLLWVLAAQLRGQALRHEALRHPLPIIGPVADFALTNQNGQSVTLADLRGKVWVADIIFTRCTGPCAKMTRQMKELQDILPAGPELKLVTLTSDPLYDTARQLRIYADKFGADSNRWWFLTGPKAEIAKLAIESLKLAFQEKQPEERETPADLFIHSTISVIVDRQGRLRGVFETTGEGINFQRVKADMLKAIQRLELEG